jgi:hypothetical protein
MVIYSSGISGTHLNTVSYPLRAWSRRTWLAFTRAKTRTARPKPRRSMPVRYDCSVGRSPDQRRRLATETIPARHSSRFGQGSPASDGGAFLFWCYRPRPMIALDPAVCCGPPFSDRLLPRAARDRRAAAPCEIRLWAERKAGDLLRDMEKVKARGSNQHQERSASPTAPPSLRDLGISKQIGEMPALLCRFHVRRGGRVASAQLLSLEILSSEMGGPSQGGGRGREEDDTSASGTNPWRK